MGKLSLRGENYNEPTLSHGVGVGVLETLLCVGAFEKTIERGRIRWTWPAYMLTISEYHLGVLKGFAIFDCGLRRGLLKRSMKGSKLAPFQH